jgi:hypothetical protein
VLGVGVAGGMSLGAMMQRRNLDADTADISDANGDGSARESFVARLGLEPMSLPGDL